MFTVSALSCSFFVETDGRACKTASDCPKNWDCLPRNVVEQTNPGLCELENCCVRPGGPGANCSDANDCNRGLLCIQNTCVQPSQCGDVVEICNNNRDDDGDQLSDCDDPDCEGEACGNRGGSCNSGTCECVPTGPEVCNDFIDNDCNGMTDCADFPACNGQPCGLTNSMCVATDCTCNTGRDEFCDDGMDNDCDTLVDCDDPDCRDEPCRAGQPLFRCTAGCSCEELTGERETVCNDGIDNDNDGASDCADMDCQEADCSPEGRVGMVCREPPGQSGIECFCPGGNGDKERFCGDGIDNDCDGVADCADVEDCPDGEVCAPNPVDASGSRICENLDCVCPHDGSVEVCSDGIDNNCDFRFDCMEQICDGAPCGDGGTCNINTQMCEMP